MRESRLSISLILDITRQRNRSFFRDCVRREDLKEAGRASAKEINFVSTLSRDGCFGRSSSVQTKLGVNLDSPPRPRERTPNRDIDRDATPVPFPPSSLEFSASCLKDFSSFGCRRDEVQSFSSGFPPTFGRASKSFTAAAATRRVMHYEIIPAQSGYAINICRRLQ